MTKLAGKNVLITGGAKGIGRLMALKIAQRSGNVVLWDIDRRGLTEVVDEIERETGRKAHGYVCDVIDRTEVYEVATQVNAEVGAIDVLINNAGVVSGKRLLETPDEKIEQTFKVNTLALFWTAKAFLPSMVARNQGHIVTISSVGGLIGSSKMVDYSASKYAAVGFEDSLRPELAQTAPGVKTLLVCPYYIDTGMFEGVKTRFSFLMPILKEQYVASMIVRCIEKDRRRLVMPRFAYVGPALKNLLPTPVFDFVINVFGGNECMEDFVGHAGRDQAAPHLKEVVNER